MHNNSNYYLLNFINIILNLTFSYVKIIYLFNFIDMHINYILLLLEETVAKFKINIFYIHLNKIFYNFKYKYKVFDLT